MDCSLSTPQGAVKGETIFQNINQKYYECISELYCGDNPVFRDVKDFASSLSSTNL